MQSFRPNETGQRTVIARSDAGLRSDVVTVLTRARSLREALQRSAEAIVKHVDAAFVRIWTLDANENVLHLEASAGMYTHIDGAHARVPVGALKIGNIAATKLPHITNDVQHDPRVSDRDWARREGLVAFAGYPLLLNERLLGVAALFARAPLNEDTLEMLASVADLICLAIDRDRADAALLLSEARHRLFAEATNEGIWYWDIDKNEVEWGDRLLEIVGVSRDSWGTTFEALLERVHGDDRPRIDAALRDHLEQGLPFEVEFRLRNGRGEFRHCVTRGKSMRDASGRPIAMAGGVYDNTAKVHADEAALAARTFAENQRAAMHATFMQTPAAIAVLQGQPGGMVFEFANARYEQLVGRHNLVGRSAREVLPELAAQGLLDTLDNVLRTGVPWVAEELGADLYRQVNGQLERGYFSFTAQPMRGEQGRLDRVMVFAVDVTHQVRAREQIEISERRYRSLVEATSAITWTTDPRGKFIEQQPQWHAFTGHEPIDVLSGAALDAVHPDDRALTQRAWIDALKNNEAFGFQHRLRRHDGVYREMTVRVVPVADGAGRLREWVGAHHDITEQREAEKERARLFELVKEREAQLRDLVENLPELAWSAQPDGHIDFYNRRWYEYTGTTFEQMQGWGWRSVHDPAMLKTVEERWQHSLERGEPFEMEFPLRGKDGAYRWFLTRVNPLRDASGRLTRWFGTNTDIQARKRAEADRETLIAALASSNAELDQFAYVASHDLKAPLRGIANLSQWIEEDLGERMSDESREHMNLLRGRVQRLERLIDGILSYSRAGRVRDKAERVDTRELLEETLELLDVKAPAEVIVATELPVVLAERVPLQQVFMNLIGNALKHAERADVRLEVRATDEGSAWEFALKDNGPGIAPEYHERVWGIFQTLQPRDRVEGTGIGLSVVKKVVETRGGRVWLDSKEGEGATFFFRWPKKPREQAPL